MQIQHEIQNIKELLNEELVCLPQSYDVSVIKSGETSVVIEIVKFHTSDIIFQEEFSLHTDYSDIIDNVVNALNLHFENISSDF